MGSSKSLGFSDHGVPTATLLAWLKMFMKINGVKYKALPQPEDYDKQQHDINCKLSS